MSDALLQLPQMVMLGSFGRNSGKTTLARAIIGRWRQHHPVIGLKVISIDSLHSHCHRGRTDCGFCTSVAGHYEWAEEKSPAKDKDTSLMLAAGAQKVFLLKSLKPFMGEAIRDFAKAELPADALLVCESNTLRKHVQPGVFVFAGRDMAEMEHMKPSAKEVFHLADRLVLQAGGEAEALLKDLHIAPQPCGGLRATLQTWPAPAGTINT